MAVLTANQLTECRQGIAKEGLPVNYTKGQVNAALQAIEDWFTDGITNRPASSLNAAINAATSPLVFTPAQKKKLFAFWALKKFDIERA